MTLGRRGTLVGRRRALILAIAIAASASLLLGRAAVELQAASGLAPGSEALPVSGRLAPDFGGEPAPEIVGRVVAPAAAVMIGPYRPSFVQCNYRRHVISITAGAGPAPGLVTQTVFYRYWVWDADLRAFVASLAPTQWGTIAAWSVARNAFGMTVYNQGTTDALTSTYSLAEGHRYVVVTDYYWLIGGAWYSAQLATNAYEVYGWAWDSGNGGIRHDGCVT